MDDHTVIIPFAPRTAEFPPPQAAPAVRAAPAPPSAEHDPSRTLVVPDYSTQLLADGPAPPTPVEAKGLPSDFVLRDRYRVLKTIGRGGFSFVYLCEHIRTGQLLAIKEAFPARGASRGDDGSLAVSDPEGHAMTRNLMLSEIAAVAKSRHRNVVRVEDSFEANGTL